jgi:hypothetical protein
MSPELAELSINIIAPDAPPAPPAPPVTQQGEPSGTNALLESIRKGKSLKPTQTTIKDNSLKGQITAADQPIASSSSVQIDNSSTPKTLTQSLSIKFDQLRKAISGSDDGEETIDDFPLKNIKTQPLEELRESVNPD